MKLIFISLLCFNLFQAYALSERNVQNVQNDFNNDRPLKARRESNPNEAVKEQKKFLEIEHPVLQKVFEDKDDNKSRTHFTNIIYTNQLLVLDGVRLYLFRTFQNSSRLDFIATFRSKNEGKIDFFKALLYQNNLVLVLGSTDLIEIYQINFHIIEDELQNLNKTSENFENGGSLIKNQLEALQKIQIHGKLYQLFLLGVNKKAGISAHRQRHKQKDQQISIYLISATQTGFMEGKLSTYKWSESTFNTVDRKSIKPFDDIHLFANSDIFHILSTSYEEDKKQTNVMVYKFLKRKATFSKIFSQQFPSDLLQFFEFNDEILVSTCQANEKNCNYHKLVQEQFKEYAIAEGTVQFILGNGTRCEKITAFEAEPNFIICILEHKMHLFGDERFDSLIQKNVPLQMNATEVLSFTNFDGKMFLGIVERLGNSKTTLKIFDVHTVEDIEIVGNSRSDEQQKLLESTLTNVRNLLIGRKKDIDEMASILKYLEKNTPPCTNKWETNINAHILSGKIKSARVKSPILANGLHGLKENVAELKNIVAKLKTSVGLRSTPKTTEIKSIDNVKYLNVENLTILDEQQYSKIMNEALIPSSENVLTLSSPIEVDVINAKSLNFADKSTNIRNKFRQDASESIDVGQPLHYQGTMEFKNIQVDEINSIDWNRFYEHEMVRDDKKVNVIRGNLTIVSADQPNLIQQLNTKMVNNIPVKDMFTMHTGQQIDSNILISRFFIKSMDVKSLNGLDIAKDVVRTDVENVIASPVVIEKLSIVDRLTLAEKNRNIFARHIFGTKYEDFQQIYMGVITINGSLTLNSLHGVDDGDFEIHIDDKVMSSNISKHFWLKSIDQVIEVPVQFTSSMKIAELYVDQLNDTPLEDYVFRTKSPTKPVKILFEDVNIEGNLVDLSGDGSQVNRIAQKAIRKNIVNHIGTSKHFMSDLKVKSLTTESLNGLKVSEFLTKSNTSAVLKNKIVKNISVSKKFEVESNFDVDSLNDISNVNESLSELLKIKNDTPKKYVITEPIKLKNIEVEYLNGYNILELLKTFQYDSVNQKRFILNKTITVEGNVTFENHLTVEEINDVNWSKYMKSLILKDDYQPFETIQIDEKVIFEAKVFTGTAQVQKLNEIWDMNTFFNNMLRIHLPQVVTGKWKLRNTDIQSLLTTSINGLQTGLLIDLAAPEVNIYSNLRSENLIVKNGCTGKFEEDLRLIKKRLQNIEGGRFKTLVVIKGVEMPLDEDMQRIVTQAVLRNSSQPQVIYGKVSFMDTFEIGNLRYNNEHGVEYNQFEAILSDALFKNISEMQKIYGSKKFNKIKAKRVAAHSLLDVRIVNDIDVKKFNRSLYRKQYFDSIPITGLKKFQKPLNIHHLYVDKINSLMVKDLVFANDELFWPSLCLNDKTVVEYLHIDEVNHMQLDFLIKNRLRLHGPAQEIYGHLKFENLQLKERAQLQTINGISIDDLVYAHATEIQEILGNKVMTGEGSSIELIGPSTVINLNGEDLVTKYRSTIFVNSDGTLRQLNALKSIQLDNKLVIRRTLNQKNVSMYRDWHNYKFNQLTQHLHDMQMQFTILEEGINRRHSYDAGALIYIDYNLKKTVEWQDNHANERNDKIYAWDSLHYQPASLLNDSCLSQLYAIKNINSDHLIINHQTTAIIKKNYGKLSIFAENYCTLHKSMMKISWQSLANNRFYYKDIEFDSTVLSIDIFEYPNLHDSSLKLIFIQLAGNKNIFMKIDLHDDVMFFEDNLFPKEMEEGRQHYKILKIKQFKPNKYSINKLQEKPLYLITLEWTPTYYAASRHHAGEQYNLGIYKLKTQNDADKFVKIYSLLVPAFEGSNARDAGKKPNLLVELVQHSEHKFHLIVASLGYWQLYVYELNKIHYDFYNKHRWQPSHYFRQSHGVGAKYNFHFYQRVILSKKISNLSVVTMYGENYLIIIIENCYYFYHYNSIKGWEELTYGCLTDIQSVFKLNDNNEDDYNDEILLVALAKNRTLTLKPVIQN